MKRAILLHGWFDKNEYYDETLPTASNSHWIPWLSKQLMMRDIHAIAPEMPNGYYPEYDVWKKELERYDLDSDTALVGHSCGGGFIVRWLSENPSAKVGKVILVAPWLGLRFNDEPFDDSFFDFEMREDIAKQTNGLHIFNSTDDFPVVQESVKIIRSTVRDVQYRDFSDKGHFTEDSLGGVEFVELLEKLLI